MKFNECVKWNSQNWVVCTWKELCGLSSLFFKGYFVFSVLFVMYWEFFLICFKFYDRWIRNSVRSYTSDFMSCPYKSVSFFDGLKENVISISKPSRYEAQRKDTQTYGEAPMFVTNRKKNNVRSIEIEAIMTQIMTNEGWNFQI